MEWLTHPPPRGWLTVFTVLVFLFLSALIMWLTRGVKADKRVEPPRPWRALFGQRPRPR